MFPLKKFLVSATDYVSMEKVNSRWSFPADAEYQKKGNLNCASASPFSCSQPGMLICKFRIHCLNNPLSCAIINNFRFCPWTCGATQKKAPKISPLFPWGGLQWEETQDSQQYRDLAWKCFPGFHFQNEKSTAAILDLTDSIFVSFSANSYSCGIFLQKPFQILHPIFADL